MVVADLVVVVGLVGVVGVLGVLGVEGIAIEWILPPRLLPRLLPRLSPRLTVSPLSPVKPVRSGSKLFLNNFLIYS